MDSKPDGLITHETILCRPGFSFYIYVSLKGHIELKQFILYIVVKLPRYAQVPPGLCCVYYTSPATSVSNGNKNKTASMLFGL